MKKILKRTNSSTSAMPQLSRHSFKKRGNEVVVVVEREATDRETEDAEVTRAWNLRPRKDGNVSGAAIGNVAVPDHQGCTKLWISLSREEIEEDLFAMTGSKHVRRQKKRAQSVQKQLDKLFPGSKFVGLTADTYRVPDPLV